MKPTHSESRPHRPPYLPTALPLLLALLVCCPVACASTPEVRVYAPTRQVLAELDDFGTLLLKAGLPPEELPGGGEVSASEARRLLLTFELYPATPPMHGPRLVAKALLHEVVEQGQTGSRMELLQRLQRYETLYVLRPDGYLAAALTGAPEQCAGPVRPRDGVLKAHEFELGAFYYRGDKDGWMRVVDVSTGTSAR